MEYKVKDIDSITSVKSMSFFIKRFRVYELTEYLEMQKREMLTWLN